MKKRKRKKVKLTGPEKLHTVQEILHTQELADLEEEEEAARKKRRAKKAQQKSA
jgi:hypothetical protein